MGQEATVPRAPRMGKGRHKTNKIREEARQPESHVPGNEAEMKKEAQLGETSCENRPTIVLGTAGQDPPGAGTATLCLNVIKDPVGADVWNSFTLAHLAAQRRGCRAGRRATIGFHSSATRGREAWAARVQVHSLGHLRGNSAFSALFPKALLPLSRPRLTPYWELQRERRAREQRNQSP